MTKTAQTTTSAKRTARIHGYTAGSVAALTMAIVFGSSWAWGAAAIMVTLFVVLQQVEIKKLRG